MAPARILVVEDDRVVARDIVQQLSRIGHHVLGTTARGDDAVSMAIETQPDLVLMDIMLEGDLDGVDAAAQIRERCGRPVVFLTAYADDETVRRASGAEPFGYLLKPFEDSQLRTAIEMALYKHQAERKLLASERRYAATLASIGDAVIATDEFAKIRFMNPVAEDLTGWASEEAIGKPISSVFRIVSEYTQETVEDPAEKALRLGITVELANHTLLLSKDGRALPIDDCGSPIVDDRGTVAGAVVVFRDMTQRNHAAASLREAQDALARTARLSMLGELAASIAHEVNQPLLAVATDAATCLHWLSDDRFNVEEARLAAQRIVRGAHRAGEVVANVRSLAKKAPLSIKELDLNGTVIDALVLLRSELRRADIATDTELATSSRFVLGDRTQILQVLVNLILNGMESMMSVSDRPRQLRVVSNLLDSDFVQATVSDTGEGIAPDLLNRVYDPFFTTKSQGTGLGLSISRSIISAHGGRMWSSQNSPYGTAFHFTLPLASVRSSAEDR